MRIQPKAWRQVALATLLLVTSLAALVPSAVFAVQAKPLTDWSFYVRSSSTSQASTLGCNQGNFDRDNGNVNSLVVLDFGAQKYLNGVEGTLMTQVQPPNDFITYAQVEAYAEQFAYWYWICTDTDSSSILKLVVSTNNSGSRVDYGGGQSWGSLVMRVRNWVGLRGYASQIMVVGGSDVEPGFGYPSSSNSWIQGFASASATEMINFGSADGCPSSVYNNALCNNGWHQYDVWYASKGGARTRALPEIYFNQATPNAYQWEMISRYSFVYQPSWGRIYFQGPLDEAPSDRAAGENDATAAWSQLWNAINSNSTTASSIAFSCEIHNSNNP